MKTLRKKNGKKLTDGEGFTFAQASQLGVPLGALLGAQGGEHDAGRLGADGGESAKNDAAAVSLPSEAEAARGPAKTLPDERAAAHEQTAKISKVALRRERAGRGGKTVTIVILPRDYKGDKAALAKDLRKALGCGSMMEEGNIVLQGDISDRAEAWFLKKGAARVTKNR